MGKLREYADVSNTSDVVCHKLGSQQVLSASGAKLLSVVNGRGGTEVFFIDKDGNLTVTGIVSSAGSAGVISIANGGTNSSTALTNGKFLSSQSGAIKEQAGIYIVQPAEGGAGIQAAVNAAGLTGGVVQLLAGTYTISSTISLVGGKNLTIQGVKDGTILNHDDSASFAVFQFTSGGDRPTANKIVNNIARGDTSITLTTHSDAANVGDCNYLMLVGLDANSEADMEIVMATEAGGNGSTGVVNLQWPIQRTMTSVTIANAEDYNNWLVVKDIRFTTSGNAHNKLAIDANTTSDSIFKNLVAIGYDNGSGAIFNIATLGARNILENLRVEGVASSSSVALSLEGQMDTIVRDCNFLQVNDGIVLRGNSNNVIIENCAIKNLTNIGIKVRNISSTPCRRLTLRSNLIEDTKEDGINMDTCHDSEILGNIFDNAATDTAGSPAAINLLTCKRTKIIANQFNNARFGIIDGTSGADNIISNNVIYKTHNTALGIVLSSPQALCNSNIIDGSSDSGIYINAAGCVVNANIAKNCTNYGIEAAGIADAVIGGNYTTGNSVKGLKLADAASNCQVFHNTFKDGVTTGSGTNYFTGNLES